MVQSTCSSLAVRCRCGLASSLPLISTACFRSCGSSLSRQTSCASCPYQPPAPILSGRCCPQQPTLPCVLPPLPKYSLRRLGQLGQSFPIPQTNFSFHAGSYNLRNTLCLLVSHSGGTFATLACSNLLKSFTSHIFAVTSEWDTQVARSIRNGIGQSKRRKTLQIRSYVFVTHVGLRPAEPCSISVAATHQLLTQILLYVMYYLRHFDVRASPHLRKDWSCAPAHISLSVQIMFTRSHNLRPRGAAG